MSPAKALLTPAPVLPEVEPTCCWRSDFPRPYVAVDEGAIMKTVGIIGLR